MGLLGNMMFLYMLMGVMVLWMVLRISRSSTGMAVLTFFFWPASVVPLITNWGQRDIDIRVPFFVTLVAAFALMYNTKEAAKDLSLQITPDQLAQIRAEDPYSAAQIERAQLAALGIEVQIEGSPAPAGVDANRAAYVSAPTPIGEEPLMEFSAAPAQIRNIPLGELRFRRGQVALSKAFANIEIAEHFRFISAQQLGTVAQIRGVTVDEASLGWIVHERVDLNSTSFWFVDVQFHEAGYLTAPSLAAPSDPFALTWDQSRTIATWAQARSDAPDNRFDLNAAKLMRHGLLLFRVADLTSAQRELGLRAARLMAKRTQPVPGWSFADYTGPEGQSLQQWISAQGAAATAEVELGDVELSDPRSS